VRILLLRPRPEPETIGLQHVMLVEPLELEVLAAATPARDQVAVVDMVLEKRSLEQILRRYRPQVLGVTGYITNVPAMIRTCRVAKAIDGTITTVAGGVHLEVRPDDLDHPSVDFRVLRNAATVWPVLLEQIRQSGLDGEPPPGVLRPGERCAPDALPPFDFSTPLPDRSTTRSYRERYFYIFHDKVALLKSSYGCPYSCSFCFCREITGHRYHERPLDEVFLELQGIHEREVYIVDDDFLVSVARVEAFLDGLQSRDIHKHYLLYGRADFIARHPTLLERFRDAGLRTVIVGFESFDDEELAGMAKGVDAATNREAVAVLQKLGVQCYATIILQPHWDAAAFKALGDTLVELGIRYVNLQPLTPLPGTGFSVPDDQLVISRSDFARWDLAHVTVRPEHMSVAAYYRQIIDTYTRVLYQPRVLASYLRHPPRSLWRMASGNTRVYRQYLHKMKEAERHG